MPSAICPVCREVHDIGPEGVCPHCGGELESFANSDAYLKEMAPKIVEERKVAGIEGLVGGLEAVIINTEQDHQRAAVKGLLRTTGHSFAGVFLDHSLRTAVPSHKSSADILVRSRQGGGGPFTAYNGALKTRHLPSTRLETFVFRCRDLERYVGIQRERGVQFVQEDLVHTGTHSFIQTVPSTFTGNSIGFVEWHSPAREWRPDGSDELDWAHEKPDAPHLANIGMLDHTATRVRARDRDAAIIEFMHLTDYTFQFAVYVKHLNSITNVARLLPDDFAMVFTSGISPFSDDHPSGPTEGFIKNYGTRVHHMAFATERIENTFDALKADGMGFLLELVGSPDEGLKQTFSEASPDTLLVNEYIHRYGDFDGFFSKSNVGLLTAATAKQ